MTRLVIRLATPLVTRLVTRLVDLVAIRLQEAAVSESKRQSSEVISERLAGSPPLE